MNKRWVSLSLAALALLLIIIGQQSINAQNNESEQECTRTVDVILLIDNSQSVERNSKKRLRITAATELVSHLAYLAKIDTTSSLCFRVGAASFGPEVKEKVDLQPISRSEQEIQDRITLGSYEGSDFLAPLDFALNQFQDHSYGTGNQRTIILFTDGEPYRDKVLRSDYFDQDSELANKMQQLKARNIRLIMVALKGRDGETNPEKWRPHWGKIYDGLVYLPLFDELDIRTVVDQIALNLLISAPSTPMPLSQTTPTPTHKPVYPPTSVPTPKHTPTPTCTPTSTPTATFSPSPSATPTPGTEKPPDGIPFASLVPWFIFIAVVIPAAVIFIRAVIAALRGTSSRKSDLAALRARLEEKRGEISALEQQIKTIESERNDLEQRLKKARNQAHQKQIHLREKLKQTKKRLITTKQKLTNAQKEIQRLEGQLSQGLAQFLDEALQKAGQKEQEHPEQILEKALEEAESRMYNQVQNQTIIGKITKICNQILEIQANNLKGQRDWIREEAQKSTPALLKGLAIALRERWTRHPEWAIEEIYDILEEGGQRELFTFIGEDREHESTRSG